MAQDVEQMGKGDEDEHDDKKAKQFPVEVNSQAVILTERKMTGREIKLAAIAQGVQIQEDFVLAFEKDNGEFHAVGDNDEVNVKKHMVFTAIAPDDNS